MILSLNILILAMIAFIIYWFWLYKPKATKIIEAGKVTITVENGVYRPDRIAAYAGRPLAITFLLKDDSHCAKKVIFQEFNISAELDKSKPTDIHLTPEAVGEFQFACPMAMYHGILEVKPPPATDIIIDGGVYQPNRIESKVGETISLRFIRKDSSRCAQTVIFSDFDIAEEIPFSDPKIITLTPEKPGEYSFTCEMGMYHGKLIVNP